MTKEEILKEAKQLVYKGDCYMQESPSTEYSIYSKTEIQKRIAKFLLDGIPINKIVYSAFVHRQTYVQHMVGMAKSYDKSPHELNIERVELMKKAQTSMEDIQFDGFENYAIIHICLIAKINDICVDQVRHRILSDDKAPVFLWFDEDDDENTESDMPTIKW